MEKDHKCLTSCFGLYADIWFETCKRESFEDSEDLTQLEEEYFAYKSKFAENLVFDPNKKDYGM